MKATGIVRRIDDLGRVVIPKEIRRTLRIREGDPLEIFTDREGEVILKKYSPIGELSEFANEYAEALNESTGHISIITDRDTVVAVAGGSKKEYLEKRISPELEKIIESKETYVATGTSKPIRVSSNEFNPDDYINQVIAPIVTQGDPIGSVILTTKESDEKMGELEQKLSETAASFLAKQMEQ
ncbi:stage V sporulation protein T [Caldisalinibacter kiritimatiensis]|uniref:Stage V sporulation protein T, AbrB family transcriptional regulator (SpoVT) n=1 Tax=Caldisalinibacter kiritimatiensis TaxID=1304284 RepID=R1CNR8_9FIRM|nr:stage V sporulation protein T [Caldisalinibacter kiritimatiensis]EOD00346.1 Stage V sporulation protein T, AbrB family transcriptional regulator (SpoVT) [Caldisalinibacter kiritimatiensis]